MQRQADYEGVRNRYPAIDTLKTTDWVELFEQRPDILHKLLRDLFVITKTQRNEDKRSGRRQKYVNGTLDELWDMITPRYSTEPFGIAVREVIGSQSVRAFASKIPMHHSSFARLINGERQIVNPLAPDQSIATLESIARAGHVHPAFFLEWRELVVLGAIQQALRAQPSLTIDFTIGLASPR